MKSILLVLIIFCFSPSAWCNSGIQYDSTTQIYHFPEQLFSSTQLFDELSAISGIQIFYDPSVVIPDLLQGANLSEEAILRFLEQNFSTIKTFNKEKEIIALQVLPQGIYNSSAVLIKANNQSSTNTLTKESIDALSQAEGEKRQQVLKAKALREASQRRDKEQQEENKIASKQRKEKSEEKRLAKERELKQAAITELNNFKSSDSEIYNRLITTHRNRFPDIDNYLNKDTEGNTADD